MGNFHSMCFLPALKALFVSRNRARISFCDANHTNNHPKY